MRSFKFTLDRKSLEVFYFSFIWPILEYADVVWDNLTQLEEDDLEKIQLEAARIICGATKLVSINNLYSETGLEPIYQVENSPTFLFYKMYHALAPRYLSRLSPSQVGKISPHITSKTHQIYETFRVDLNSYQNPSFHPQSTLGTLLLTRFGQPHL